MATEVLSVECCQNANMKHRQQSKLMIENDKDTAQSELILQMFLQETGSISQHVKSNSHARGKSLCHV
jgi:hypothetical protein